MSTVYLWIVTAVTGAVALSTLVRLWSDRNRLSQEELRDEDRLFAWRIVLFLIYPLMTLIDLRATMVASRALSGSVPEWTYGLFWYWAVPQGLPTSHDILIAVFTGAVVQLILALMLVPALLFRPHPFLSTVLGYAIVSIMALNLIVEPLLSLLGLGGSRWHVATLVASAHDMQVITLIYGVLSLAFIAFARSKRVRVWFARLSRPLVSEQLSDAQLQWKVDPHNAANSARLSILYEKAGLRRHAIAQWKRLNSLSPDSIYSAFVEAMLAYRQRNYKVARKQFLYASDCQNSDPLLKGALLAAAGCSAFASGDLEGALNLSERALEFDEASLVARMVKVDVYMRTGRKELAGEEIISALRRGFDIDLEKKIPLDADLVLKRINKLGVQERVRRKVAART